MKLELRHLAAYLPYKLKLNKQTYKNGTYQGIYELTTDNINQVINNVNNNWENKSYFPILKPLSDLTKEIEVNGLKFVPIEWLEEKYYTLDLHKQCERITEDSRWINHCEYILIQYLLEWNFDIFQLTENKLAINSNDLIFDTKN